MNNAGFPCPVILCAHEKEEKAVVHMRTRARKALLNAFAMFFLACSACSQSTGRVVSTYTPTTSARLAVVGVSNSLEDDDWRDLRVGFGLQGMLTEALYETGFFQLIEEKQEIRARLGVTVEDFWSRARDLSSEELGRIADMLDADVLAYGTVVEYATPESGLRLAVFSRQTNAVRIKVKVCLYEKASRELRCANGEGNAEFVGESVLFEFRDDGRLSTKSLIGEASKKGIDDALAKLLPGS